MHTKVKICGIKTVEEVEIINEFPVSYIGFIFAKSKRQVDIEKVLQMKKILRKDIQTVGVFLNEELETVNHIVKECGLDFVQLHGDETVDYCTNVCTKVWKTISIKDESSIKIIEKYKNDVDGVLLDTFYKGETGGTGKTFNWDKISSGLNSIEIPCKVIIAGGISPENAARAIEIFKPHIIDVNSKVETNLIKDKAKINELFIGVSKNY